MMTPDALNYRLATVRIPHKHGHPFRKRMMALERSVKGSELRDARIRYLAHGAWMQDLAAHRPVAHYDEEC